jgi:hypothetical protein
MCAIDGENLELFALDTAHPAGNVVGVPIRDSGDGVLKLGQSSLAFRELIQLTQRDPALILATVPAQDRRKEVSEQRRGQNRDRQAIQQQADFGEQIAA